MEQGDFDLPDEFSGPLHEPSEDNFSPPFPAEADSEIPQPIGLPPLEASELVKLNKDTQRAIDFVAQALTGDDAQTYGVVAEYNGDTEPSSMLRAAHFKLPHREDPEAPPQKFVVFAWSRTADPQKLDRMTLAEAQEEARTGERNELDTLFIARLEPALEESEVDTLDIASYSPESHVAYECWTVQPADEVFLDDVPFDLLNLIREGPVTGMTVSDGFPPMISSLLDPRLEPDPEAKEIFSRPREPGRGHRAYQEVNYATTDKTESARALEILRKSAGFFEDLFVRSRQHFSREFIGEILRDRDAYFR